MTSNWYFIKTKVNEVVFTLPRFLSNPVQGMRSLPNWDWTTLLILQGLLSAICAILGNIIDRDMVGVVTGIVIAPIANMIMATLVSGFFLYVFRYLFQREIDFRLIYLNLVFAMIPFQVVGILSSKIPPVAIIGAAATTMLLYVGFVHNFQIEAKKLQYLLYGLLAAYLLSWMTHIIRLATNHEFLRQKATPESLDILEKELRPEDEPSSAE